MKEKPQTASQLQLKILPRLRAEKKRKAKQPRGALTLEQRTEFATTKLERAITWQLQHFADTGTLGRFVRDLLFRPLGVTWDNWDAVTIRDLSPAIRDLCNEQRKQLEAIVIARVRTYEVSQEELARIQRRYEDHLKKKVEEQLETVAGERAEAVAEEIVETAIMKLVGEGSNRK